MAKSYPKSGASKSNGTQVTNTRKTFGSASSAMKGGNATAKSGRFSEGVRMTAKRDHEGLVKLAKR